MPGGAVPRGRSSPCATTSTPTPSCCGATASNGDSQRARRDARSGGSSSTRRSRPTSRSTTDAVKKRDLTELASKLVERYPRAVVAESLDKLKDLGFEFATRSGLTISISDVRTPGGKAALLEQFEAEAEKVESQYDRGVITDDERRQKEIEVWSEATARGP